MTNEFKGKFSEKDRVHITNDPAYVAQVQIVVEGMCMHAAQMAARGIDTRALFAGINVWLATSFLQSVSILQTAEAHAAEFYDGLLYSIKEIKAKGGTLF